MLPVAVAGETCALNVTACPETEGFSEEARLAVVTALLTASLNTAEVLGKFAASPEYTAVSEWLPADNADVESDAAPLVTGTVPSEVAPSRNCTAPVAVAGETPAINVTAWLTVAGLGEAANVAVEAAFDTLRATTADELVE
jgi:hypothetical protein